MKEAAFWTLITLFNWGATGDDEAVIKPVVDALSELSTEEIYAFEEILTEKLHALDAKKYAKEIGEDAYVNDEQYFSVDGFLYSRCVIVANGEEFYEHIIKSPTDFPKDMDFEALLYVAQKAYEKKTGKEWGHVSKLSYETYSNKSGWK